MGFWMRQITGLIWHDKSCLATQGLSLWTGAKASLLLLPPRTATHKLQCDSCAIFFHIAMYWCRGFPDIVSCPFQQGYHCICSLHFPVGGVGGKGISVHYQWEEKWSDPLSWGTHLVSKTPNAQRGLHLTPPLRNRNTIITSFGTYCHSCVLLPFAKSALPLFPLQPFPNSPLPLFRIGPGKEVLLLFLEIWAFSSKIPTLYPRISQQAPQATLSKEHCR